MHFDTATPEKNLGCENSRLGMTVRKEGWLAPANIRVETLGLTKVDNSKHLRGQARLPDCLWFCRVIYLTVQRDLSKVLRI